MYIYNWQSISTVYNWLFLNRYGDGEVLEWINEKRLVRMLCVQQILEYLIRITARREDQKGVWLLSKALSPIRRWHGGIPANTKVELVYLQVRDDVNTNVGYQLQ